MIVVRMLLLCCSIGVSVRAGNAQSLFGSRSVALGGNGAAVRDTRGFESNPAGLTRLRDWEFSIGTYSGIGSNTGFVFDGITFGKRFLENNAVAVQYSPGALLEFVVPSQIVSTDPQAPRVIDRKFSYGENFTFGYAYQFNDAVAVGLGGRLLQQKIADKAYSFTVVNGNTVPVITDQSFSENILQVDVAAQWHPSDDVALALSGKNLLNIKASKFTAELAEFGLPAEASVDFGMRYDAGSSVSLMAMGSSLASGSLGYEIVFPSFNFSLRNSIYANKDESPFVYAVAIGAGLSYRFLEIDLSYLRFVNQSRHSGTGNLASFSSSDIHNLGLNRFTQDRVALSVKAIFGNVRESLVRIEAVEMTSAVYPSSYELFAFRPIGRVRVRNISEEPVQAKASFFVEKYMDAPTETPSVHLLPGEEKEISFNAVLNDRVKSVNSLTIREGNVYVSATPTEDYDDRVQTKILIHGRNDWDGDVRSLRHFVTPDDPDVIRYTRDILLQFKDSLAAVPRELEQVAKARILFNSFAGKLVHVGDPKLSTDYVQYPSETMTMKSGDCDDMTTAFASLLSSVGISTAFVDVVPPQHPEESHIYMMFDTGLDLRFANMIAENPKRYVVRKNARGNETVWLPIETTAITRGFDEAWSIGAREYFEDVEINLGLIKGWVTILDVN